MNLQQRIELLVRLGEYLEKDEKEWQEIKSNAGMHNGWFIEDFVNIAVKNITQNFLKKEKLEHWANHYHLDDNVSAKKTGLVMAGNIPLVGFHDFLCIFLSGHHQIIKLSSKDDVLLKHIVQKMLDWDNRMQQYVSFAPMLKGCDAYIATGSNNTARYFEEYFSKYPGIIRRNRTAVAILSGTETTGQLNDLADDIHLYFGLGCRNVTKLYVPQGYDFIPLLKTFDRYKYFIDHHKFKNNYDYQLSIALMNNIYYMTNGSTLLIEDTDIFTAISRVNYNFYTNVEKLVKELTCNESIQCITGSFGIPFGRAQCPGLMDYADGIDTMQFLLTL